MLIVDIELNKHHLKAILHEKLPPIVTNVKTYSYAMYY